MSKLLLDLRRQAKGLIEAGKTSAEVGALLDIKPGTIREWKRRYMWDGPEGLDRPCNEDLDTDQVPAEYERVMSLDVMDTLDWIRRMPMPRRIDAILKRERALELLSKRAERVIGGFARSHGQQSKVIQVNSVTAILSSHESSGCGVSRGWIRLSRCSGASAVRFNPPKRLLPKSIVAPFILLQHLQMRFGTHNMHTRHALFG